MADDKLEVVVPVYNEREIIEQLHQRLVAACESTGLGFRLTYVDDGGADGTAEWIAAQIQSAEQSRTAANSFSGSIKLLQLSRNFGQPAAILAGLKSADADIVVLMDGDLQDPPELIPKLVNVYRSGAEIVLARRTSRRETLVRGFAFRIFHAVFRYLSDSQIPPNTGTFCLLNRRATQAIVDLPEAHRFFPGLRAWVGFRQAEVFYQRPARAGGTPKQTFSRLTKYALDAVFGYSLKPLRLLTGSGILICAIAFSLMLWFVGKRMLGWESASVSFVTLTCAVFGLGGFQLIGMGILGEYIGRIYDEVKRRPPYIVTGQLSFEQTSQTNDQHKLIESVPLRRAG